MTDGSPRLIAAASLVARPWANGAGTTREIASEPGRWRLSLATIDRAAPFSALPGIDRLFALALGKVRLDGEAAPFPATVDDLSAPLAFAGETPVNGEPLGGMALALNLMATRGMASGTMARCEGGKVDAGPGVTLVFASQPVTVKGNGAPCALARHDTLLVPARARLEISGPCLVAQVMPG